MTESSAPARRPWRVSMRGLILLVLILALGLGWATTRRRAERERLVHEQRLRYAEAELRRARDELQDQLRGPRPDRTRPFWEAGLEGSNLAGMTLASDGNAFQRASFRDCRLEGATLEGGVASFQLSRFDGAKLTSGRLTGGDASFQGASFVGADLTNATLIGGPSSFQRATFEGATLIGAKLSGSFREVNLSGAKLAAADLAAIARDDLASCYFQEPPTYDARTRLPPGFDPDEHSWRRVESRAGEAGFAQPPAPPTERRDIAGRPQ